METLLKRTLQGSDGLIRSILLRSHFKVAEITVSVMDGDDANEWINVKFTLRDIKEFNVSQKFRISNIVLSSGIQFKIIDGVNYLDFSSYSGDPETLTEFRNADIYFGFTEYEYEILPYLEV
jgi:hypothetical protein